MAKINENKPSTIVLIAALNEEKGIGPTLLEIQHFLEKPFCLVVDGKSTDGTAKVASALGAEVIFQKGSGKGDAIATAVEYVGSLATKYVIFIDADFTYPAEYLPKMIKILEENPEIGMVCGNRFNRHFHLENMPDIFYTGNRLIAFVHNLLNGVKMRDPLTGLRVVRLEILKNWKPEAKGFDIEIELNQLVERKGYLISEIPISYRTRLGEKKLRLIHGFAILRRIILEAF